MRKYILLSLLLSACISVHSQVEFATIKNEVNRWYAEIASAPTLSSKESKTILFTAQHYLIDGVVSKGILCEGSIAKFYDTSSLTLNLLLEGRVSYQYNRLVIEGIKHDKTSTGTNKMYGSFYVYNMDDYSMNYKPKKAGPLRIKCSKASYLESFYSRSPVIVRLNENNSSIYIDGKAGGKKYSFLSADIPYSIKDDDSFDVVKIILLIGNNATLCDEEGMVFKGRLKTILQGGDSILFQLMEGEKTGIPFGPKKQTVIRQNGDWVYTQENNEDNKLLSKEIMYVKDNGTMSELWNIGNYYEHCYLAKLTYRNGNYYEGKIKSVITDGRISSTATNGVFKYSNGDRFEGNLSTKTVGPFFMDGTTILADGTKHKGNWLENYKLSKSQLAEVCKCPNPSSAKELAQKLMRSNRFQEYEYSGKIDWFDPKRESRYTLISNDGALWNIPLATSYITYDKKNKRYSCRWKRKQIELEFAVDDKGLRKWEIVYGDNDKPEFINEFTWYSNGEIESIKSYNFNTKKIYLSCNFFSDGTIRSAYQYGPGNSGENILRKSKESHPTYGGFTSKLYDLNGQYERSISWKIGESIYGGSSLIPSIFDFKKLKPIVQESDELIPKAKEVIIKEENSENKVFDKIEQMPEFAPCTYEVPIYNKKGKQIGTTMKNNPGGPDGLFQFLSDNIRYPVVAEANGIQGRVICTFVVERDGSITDVKVVKSIDPLLDEEAVRVLSKMPKWKPGMEKETPVRVKYTVPVTFKLQ